jgi:D-alanine-D-alanine ligase
MKVLIVYGGSSSEREVSLRSGKGVGDALIAAGHEVTYFDPGDDTIFSLLKNFVLDKDVVFPVLHGRGGEDGAIQVVLEQLGVAYVGSSPFVSRDCFDKVTTLQRLHDAGITVPPTDIINAKQLRKHPLAKAPYVLKPRSEGSSVDTFIIRDITTVEPTMFDNAFARHGQLLIEMLVEGLELTVPVLGQQALPVIEIIPPSGGDFDYQNKYNGMTQELCPPQHMPPEIQTQAQAIALQVHNLMGCRDLSRTDLMWSSKDGKLYVLEINTLPGMTDQSLYPKSAGAAGIRFPALADQLVKMAYARKQQ